MLRDVLAEIGDECAVAQAAIARSARAAASPWPPVAHFRISSAWASATERAARSRPVWTATANGRLAASWSASSAISWEHAGLRHRAHRLAGGRERLDQEPAPGLRGWVSPPAGRSSMLPSSRPATSDANPAPTRRRGLRGDEVANRRRLVRSGNRPSVRPSSRNRASTVTAATSGSAAHRSDVASTSTAPLAGGTGARSSGGPGVSPAAPPTRSDRTSSRAV